MKRNVAITILLCTLVQAYAQRYDNTRTYDIVGLPDGDKIMDALKIAIPLIVVGFLIAYIFMWGKSDEDKQKGEGTSMGCIGVIIMGFGIFCLLPLWAWVEAVFVSLISIATILAIVYVIWSWISGKMH